MIWNTLESDGESEGGVENRLKLLMRGERKRERGERERRGEGEASERGGGGERREGREREERW